MQLIHTTVASGALHLSIIIYSSDNILQAPPPKKEKKRIKKLVKKGISLRKKEREEKRKKAITLDDKQHIPPSLSGNSHRSLQATGHKVSINVNLENAHSYALSHHRNL